MRGRGGGALNCWLPYDLLHLPGVSDPHTPLSDVYSGGEEGVINRDGIMIFG